METSYYFQRPQRLNHCCVITTSRRPPTPPSPSSLGPIDTFPPTPLSTASLSLCLNPLHILLPATDAVSHAITRLSRLPSLQPLPSGAIIVCAIGKHYIFSKLWPHRNKTKSPPPLPPPILLPPSSTRPPPTPPFSHALSLRPPSTPTSV